MKEHQEEMGEVRYGLFRGVSGGNGYLLDASGDSEASLLKAKNRINQINSWGDLGKFLALIEEKFVDDGSGSFLKAEEHVFCQAKMILSEELKQQCQISCQIEIEGRRLVSIRPV